MSLWRMKAVNADVCDTPLRRCLSAFDLTILGIGAIIGAGIFVLTGIAAATKAGPAIVLSYVVAGLACGFTALAYAELASAVGGCGSAYGYAYAGLGEIVAWIIGWDLILEYGVSTATVAIGWSGYVSSFLKSQGVVLPATWAHANISVLMADGLRAAHVHVPSAMAVAAAQGGLVNAPAALIILALSVLLAVGVRQSASLNNVMVVVKLVAIAIFIGMASFNVHPRNWNPFAPFGWSGVMAGAGKIFFAYIGFDAVSTATEEANRPQRDVPIGIVVSLLVCSALYIIVAGLLTGIVPYPDLNTAAPVADSMLRLGYPWAAMLIAAGAIAGLTTVMLVLYYALTRIVLAMSRDGLLPPVFSAVHPKTRTPVRVIMLFGILIAVIAGFTPIDQVVNLVNIGTLAAFVLVCGGVMVLRRTRPELPRPFRAPGGMWVPSLGILFCVYLMLSLPAITWIRFVVWLGIGLVVYFAYSHQHSLLQKENAAPGAS
ncbi:MAG TPA: amino acid permease [Acidiferrobacteraceae bacterium]|nr:amino acid permease [Acidiferrobacteraceae bacterium]